MMVIPPRTKQYMANRNFNAKLLWYPKVVALQRLPSGLPAGLQIARFHCLWIVGWCWMSSWRNEFNGYFVWPLKAGTHDCSPPWFAHWQCQAQPARGRSLKLLQITSSNIARFCDLLDFTGLLNILRSGWMEPSCWSLRLISQRSLSAIKIFSTKTFSC